MKVLLVCTLLVFGNATLANVDGAIEKLISRIDTKVWNGALDNLENEDKKEIKQGLKTILDILKGRRVSEVKCIASSTRSGKYTFYNGRDEFGGNFSFLSSCKESLENQNEGLICGKSASMSKHQIYKVRNGQTMAGTMSFKSDCVESINSINESGLFCAKNDRNKYQVFNARTGATVGGGHTFKSNCLESL